MTDIAAAIGIVELKRYEKDMIPYRRHICNVYNDYFGRFEWARTPVIKNSNSESSCHLYPLRIKNISEVQRDLIIQKIFDRDVAVNVHFIPLPMMSYYKSLGYNINQFPVSYSSYKSEISLPVYYGLTDEQLRIVCKAVVEAVEEVLLKVSPIH
jgi:dTDP-4-amino-4,6-dideoxygalactose transaminase